MRSYQLRITNDELNALLHLSFVICNSTLYNPKGLPDINKCPLFRQFLSMQFGYCFFAFKKLVEVAERVSVGLPKLGMRAKHVPVGLPKLGMRAEHVPVGLPKLGMRAEHVSVGFPKLGMGAEHISVGLLKQLKHLLTNKS